MKFSGCEQADKEEIFIDRDGVAFKWILSPCRPTLIKRIQPSELPQMHIRFRKADKFVFQNEILLKWVKHSEFHIDCDIFITVTLNLAKPFHGLNFRKK